MQKIIITIVLLSTLVSAKLIYKNGVVVDTRRGLQWQTSSCKKAKWEDAIRYCRNLTYLGHSDWRLPTVKELKTIRNPRRNPAWYPIFDAGGSNTCRANIYWSSTPSTFEHSHTMTYVNDAWYINFQDAHVGAYVKRGYNYVRCVRRGH